ncbi:MAG: hypothetical protein AAB355_00340 [Patescibacteria group bacterium]
MEHVLRFRVVNRSIFLNIKKGVKKIETRAATVRYRKIEKGDTLVFVCGKERFRKKIAAVKIFKSIPALFRVYRVKDIFPDLSTVASATAEYHSFPDYKEKIKKFGLVAFRLG